MSALFGDPVRGVLGGKQVMIVGVIDETYNNAGTSIPLIRTEHKLLVSHANGQLSLADIGEVRTLWKYGVIPVGKRAGETGWWDDIPEEEEPTNPIDVDDDGG
jgi:hypothetical protein